MGEIDQDGVLKIKRNRFGRTERVWRVERVERVERVRRVRRVRRVERAERWCGGAGKRPVESSQAEVR